MEIPEKSSTHEIPPEKLHFHKRQANKTSYCAARESSPNKLYTPVLYSFSSVVCHLLLVVFCIEFEKYLIDENLIKSKQIIPYQINNNLFFSLSAVLCVFPPTHDTKKIYRSLFFALLMSACCCWRKKS